MESNDEGLAAHRFEARFFAVFSKTMTICKDCGALKKSPEAKESCPGPVHLTYGA